MKHLNTVVFVWLLLAAAVWCFFEIQAIAEITGKMNGFHPLVLLAVPAGMVMSVLCFAMSPIRNRLAALCVAIVPAAALFAPIYFGFNILVFAWSDAIQQTAATNEVAIKSTDFSTAVFEAIPYKDHERMVPVKGFVWPNSAEMIRSYTGAFSGFVVDDVPHVYVHPIRNGSQGVVWIENKDIIGKDPHVRYVYSGTTNWYLWITSPVPYR